MIAPAIIAQSIMNHDLETSISHWTSQASTRLQRNLFRIFKSEGLAVTPEQWIVLVTLWEQEGISQSELALALDRDNSSVTRIIDTMTKNDLLERRPHETDRRAYCIHLTENGKALQSKLVALAGMNVEEALRGISGADLQTTLSVLKKITQNLGT